MPDLDWLLALRVAIAGAGIGGLAAAVALRRVGVETTVVERAAEIREIGAGLSLWPNAMNALRELGVDETVRAAGSIVERVVSQTPDGRPIAVTDIAAISKLAGAPCVCVHRGALQRILLEELPPSAIRTGARCVGFEESALLLESGKRIEADAVIGADGILSAVRAQLHGNENPRYAGYTCWRGIYRGAGIMPERIALLVAGGGSQFGVWPCGPGQFYWFLTKNAAQGERRLQAAEVVGGWTASIRAIVEGTPDDAIIRNDITDRPPLRQWGVGRVTLLGDAAHATTPNLGQGACQAIEDAVVLAVCLRGKNSVDSALREYERLRIPRTSAIVRDSWQGGRMLQLDRPALEAVRNWFMGSTMGQRISMRIFRELLTYRVPSLTSPRGAAGDRD